MTPFSFLYFKKLMGKNRVEFPAICIQLNCSISLVCVFHTFRMFLQTQIKQTNIFSHNISGPCGSRARVIRVFGMLLRKKYLVAISLVEMGTAGVPEMAFGLLITMAGPSEGIAIWGTRGQAKIKDLEQISISAKIWEAFRQLVPPSPFGHFGPYP